MATKIVIVLEDDLDGGPADQRLEFGLGDAEYTIDLNAKNATRFRRQLAPFIEHGRKVGRAQRRRSPARPASARERSSRIRAWAKDQGIAVNDRGRIPAGVAEQYDAAHR
jgi:Lsr2